MSEVFNKLSSIDVSKHVEVKEQNGVKLSYLSWAWAWAEVKKVYPDAEYVIFKQPNGLPYVYDPNTGFMVYTQVTIEGQTYDMWLPVMDSSNRAMKAVAYEVKTKTRTFVVNPATMFDINKAIMRCLVKNLAMFGLGLNIYVGEDLPVTPKKGEEEVIVQPEPANPFTDVIEDAVDDAIANIKAASSVEELVSMYNELVGLQGNKRFIAELTKRKNELKNKAA